MIRGQMVVRRGSADDTFILLIYCFVLKFPSLNLGLQAAPSIKPYQPRLPWPGITRTSLREQCGVQEENTMALGLTWN